MTALVWSGAFLLVAAVGAVLATYDQVERALDQEEGCRCPECDAGGSCAKDWVDKS